MVLVAGTRCLGDFGAAVALGQEPAEHSSTHVPGGESRVGMHIATAALAYFALAVTLLDCCDVWSTRQVMPDPRALAEASRNIRLDALKELVQELLLPAMPMAKRHA